MSAKLSGTKQLGAMMVVTSIAQVLAIFKSTITAANFGACTELDAYHFANNLSTFFLTFISTGISTVIIPAYIKKKDRRAIDTFISVIFTVIGALLIFMFLGRGFLVEILTIRDAVFKSYVCSVMALTIFIQLLPAILGVTTAYYQTEGKYNIPKVILLVSNIGVVLALVALKDFTIYEYLWILLIGALGQFIVDIAIAVKLGFRYKICFDLSNIETKELFKTFLPTVFSSGVYKVHTLVDAVLSSSLGTGQLTLLTYSNTMVGMVNNMFIGNLSTYAYPKIVSAVKNGEKDGQIEIWKYATSFHSIMCLLIAGFISVGREFIAMLYEHGKFSPEASNVVYICMCIYIFGQQNNVVRDLIYRYFYANGNTIATAKNSLTTSIVNVIVSVILAQFIGIYGLVLGTTMCGLYSLCSITWRFKNNYGFLVSIKEVVIEFTKDNIALFLAVIVVFVLKSTVSWNVVINFLLYGCLTVVVYVGCLFVFKSKVFKNKL